MKRNILIYTLIATFALGGCSQENITNNAATDNAIVVNITATRDERQPITRTEYDDNDPTKLVVRWKSDRSDRICVFATNSSATNGKLFSIIGDLRNNGKDADFSGIITPIDASAPMTLYAYYPYDTANKDSKAIILHIQSQVQDGINTTSHLATYDFMAAIPVTYPRPADLEGSLAMKFKPLLTVMSFDVVNPSATEPLKVENVKLFSESGNLFTESGTVDITDPTFPITSINTKDNIFLTVSGNNTIAAGATGRFSMMMFPLTDGLPATLKAQVYNSSGDVFYQEKAIPAGGFTRGGRYIMKLDKLEKYVFDSSIELDKTAVNMTVGDTETITATVKPANTTDKRITWKVLDPSIIDFDPVTGTIKALAPGTVKIMAISKSSNTATCTVTITKKDVPVTGITLNKTGITLKVGDTETLTATIAPADATNNAVIWSNSAPTVATISVRGVVTAIKAGTATITVTTGDGKKSATCTVTVKTATGQTPADQGGTITNWDPVTGGSSGTK